MTRYYNEHGDEIPENEWDHKTESICAFTGAEYASRTIGDDGVEEVRLLPGVRDLGDAPNDQAGEA